ncbi:Ig-like domain-containing protein [Priestia filamentosa]|uniref:Ig-like domain-containing protein n=1 Tax=Priestia filamentosa TaxID=1402861 RepID=UPI003978AE48
MRKWILILLIIILIGGGGYVGYQTYKGKSTSTTAQPFEEDTVEIVKEKSSKQPPTETNVETNKTWELSFDDALDPNTLSNVNITIKDTNNNVVNTPVRLVNENKTIQISPPAEGYKEDETYHLHIDKGLLYAGGEPVSKSFDLYFETEREEIEEVTLNKNLVVADKSQVEKVSKNSFKVDQSIKKDLKKNDIIVIPSKEDEEGQAVKVVSAKLEDGKYTVNTTEPSFTEIYEELNLNKTYEFNPDDFEFGNGVEGINVNPIAEVNSDTMVAAANSSSEKEKNEFSFSHVRTSYSKSNGFEIKLQDFDIGKKKNKLSLNGSLAVMQPEVDTDIKIKKFKLNKLKLAMKNRLEENVTVKVKGRDQNFDYKELFNDVNGEKKFKDYEPKEFPLTKEVQIGKGKLRTSVPGLSIILGVNLEIKSGVNGELELALKTEIDTEKGFIYENKKMKAISNVDSERELNSRGNAGASFTAGVKSELKVRSFGIVGAGLEGSAGSKAHGEFSVGTNREERYACGLYELMNPVSASGVVDVSNPFTKKKKTLLEHELYSKDFNKIGFNTCLAYQGISSDTKTLSLKTDEEKSVDVSANYLNLLNSKKTKEEIKDYKLLNITASNKNVVEIKKKKDSLNIIALKKPKHKTSELTLEYTVESPISNKKQTSSITIPITITNFKEPVKVNYDQLLGEWSKDTQHDRGVITVTKASKDGMDFNLNATRGAHAGGFEGRAKFTDEKTAIYVEEETQCQLSFNLGSKDAIEVETTPECYKLQASGVTFEGTYKKGVVENEKKTLYEQGILLERHDLMIQDLVGEDYDMFVESTEQYREGDDIDGLGAKVIFGGVRGLYSIMETIYMFDTPGNVYAAVIVDGNKVKFYTDNDYYKDHLPETVEEWRSRFPDYPVEIIYKEIPLR